MVKKHMNAMTANNREVKASIPASAGFLIVGQKMDDGSIFAGISPDTGRNMFVTPADAPLVYTFNQAQDHAAALDAHGHHDWRMPTRGELKMLFDNRAAIGGFSENGVSPGGWYWSSTQETNFSAWSQRFSDGVQAQHGDAMLSALRCVRDE